MQVIDRFLNKVAIDQVSGCWNWSGCIEWHGYGWFRAGRNVYAHRWAYEYFVGQIPPGYQVDHLCRNRKCVRPSHLEAVTPQENTRRGETVASRNAAKTECKRGHVYNEPNTGLDRNGNRFCRPCKKLTDSRRRTR